MATNLLPETERVEICREADDLTTVCRFASHCHASRQQLHHGYKVRGESCGYFRLIQDTLRERAAADAALAPITDSSGLAA